MAKKHLSIRNLQNNLYHASCIITITLLITFFLTSCSSQTKESYLEDYKTFISEVSEKNLIFSDDDWEKADQKYEKFTDEWYKKFEDEFTWKEEILLGKYSLQYNFFKAKKSSTNFFNTYLKKDYDKLKEQIKYYSENEMEEDLEFLIREATEMGDSATRLIEDIFKDLEIEFKVSTKK